MVTRDPPVVIFLVGFAHRVSHFLCTSVFVIFFYVWYGVPQQFVTQKGPRVDKGVPSGRTKASVEGASSFSLPG